MKTAIFFSVAGVISLSACAKSEIQKRPNIVIILADDMGYSDISCYGSEINTPNLNRLAENGLRYTQFYNSARCCPTRASLLTGLHPHQAGIGWMTDKIKGSTDSYKGFLNHNCVTIAEALKSNGYFTTMAGKWHGGASDISMWPIQRGFDRFFGIPQGAGFYWGTVKSGKMVVQGNDTVYSAGETLPDDFYTTLKWSEYSIKFINEALSHNKPFFLYLAENAPHWPLQAPDSVMKKYIGKYIDGWETLRETRYKRMIDLGIIDESCRLSEKDKTVPDWKSLSEIDKITQDSIMAVYAACIELMDYGIGQVVNHLEKVGQLDNTLIFFLSDNGGCAEGPANGLGRNSGKGKIGSKESFVQCGRGWANAQNTPFRMYKHWTHEGGIHTPLIVHWPAGISAKGEFRNQLGHIVDIMTTCIDVTHSAYPKIYQENNIIPMEGVSLKPSFSNESLSRDTLCWEHEGNRAVRAGNWKLVFKPARLQNVLKKEMMNWELYNLQEDPSETKDLSDAFPEKVWELNNYWTKWAKDKKVLPWPWSNKKK